MTRFDMRLNMLAGTLGTEKGQSLEEVFVSVLLKIFFAESELTEFKNLISLRSERSEIKF